MKEFYIMDGNEACATAAYLFTQIAGIYPITPATPMATLCDAWSSNSKPNIFNEKVRVIEMQSEAGASALVHGALQAGSLSTTFTASQGLLLMIPSMYKIAGEMLPLVIHVAARSLSTHALSIFGDHQDIYAARSTGFAFLSSSNVQDAYYMSLVSHLSAIKSSIPFLHFFDGFRTSHELNKIQILKEEAVLPLIDREKLLDFKQRSINIGQASTRGVSQTEDVYFQNTEARNKFYQDLPDIVNSYMQYINLVAETEYEPFNYYGSPNAKHVIVAMGSVTDTIKLTVEELLKEGEEIGVINVRLYRPFSSKYFFKALPKSVTKITVLDKTKEASLVGAPLYLDVCEALKDERIQITGGIYGLSSKNTTPRDIKSVFNNMKSNNPINNFSLGIDDDVTHKSLSECEFNISKDFKELKIYGFGSDGMVSASKNILKTIGEKDGVFVQGYFEYDSKKSGGVTISHLRIDNEPINAPYYPEAPNLVVVTKESYLKKFNVLNGIKKGGIFILSTSKKEEELDEFLPNYIKETVKTKNIKFFTCDTNYLDKKYDLNGKINNIIALYILRILGEDKEGIEKFKKDALKLYSLDESENTLKSLEVAFDFCKEIDKENLTVNEKENEETEENIYNKMVSRNGNKLKVSNFLEHKSGNFIGGTSSSDKRKITDLVPKWKKENCIECNMCSFVCPHSVIRPFSLTQDDEQKFNLTDADTIPSIGEKDKSFYLGVSESNCTGCSLCINSCPGKGNEKALYFDEYNERLDYKNEQIFNQMKNDTPFNKYSVKGLGFQGIGFEYPGACAGCGESGYLKILTSLYKDEIVIANATGCSSIYGSSLPSLPYKVPWISSLFEDNAEFGYGLYMSYKVKREMIRDLMFETKDIVEDNVKAIYKKWIDNMNDYNITSEVKEELEVNKIPKELEDLIDYIPSRSVWIVGGDGWAYDIGYGGLDHILHSNENVNILVLDTETYSNTGGQMSKAAQYASVAEFSSSGKKTNKKDLFRMAMSIPNVYVSSVSMGANANQTLKSFKEAYEHDGPSIIIAYSTCIAHGISGGLRNSLEQEKLLVESGYNLLMRYNPTTKNLTIDSKEPDFSKYMEALEIESRYKKLKNMNEKEYEKLFELNLDAAKERYAYYKSIETE